MAKFETINLKGKYVDESIILCILNPMERNYKGAVNVDTYNVIESMKAVSRQFQNSDELKLNQFVLSFDLNELDDPYVADSIAKEIMDYLGKEYQAVYRVREDGGIYIDIVMNTVSYVDGHQFADEEPDDETDEETEYDLFYSKLYSILGKYGINGPSCYRCEIDGGKEKCTCWFVLSITRDTFEDMM